LGGKNGRMKKKKILAAELDAEWLQLIEEAKKIGLNIEEIRDFISNNQNNLTVGDNC